MQQLIQCAECHRVQVGVFHVVADARRVFYCFLALRFGTFFYEMLVGDVVGLIYDAAGFKRLRYE